jgi:protein-tyrosine-phosphatase
MTPRISAETFGIDLASTLSGSALRLADEFQGVFSLATVEAYLHASAAHLESRATVSRFLPLIIERRAYDQLRAVAGAVTCIDDRPPVVLFLGADAGRPRMAESLFHHLVGERAVVGAASSRDDPVDPLAVQALDEIGVPLLTAAPHRWSDAGLRLADVVVTVGCADPCALYPDTRYEDWDVSAPAPTSLESLRGVRDDLLRRTAHLVDALRLTA